MEQNSISFTPESAKKFIREYNSAVREGKEQFTFEGNELVRGYAYYMIQYLQMNNIVSGTFDDRKIFKL